MNRSQMLIPALDSVDLNEMEVLVKALAQHPGVYGFKLGFGLGLSHGLPAVVERIRGHSDKAIIYDHQKAGTDIPDTGKLFAKTLASAGVTEGILFPQAGPHTQAAWIEALQEAGLEVIVGGAMTHPAYLASEGGYLRDDAAVAIYRQAREAGVRRFVMPLTKPALCKQLWREAELSSDSVMYSPGLGAQGGDPRAFSWLQTHLLIVGRALRQASDPRAFVDEILAPDEGATGEGL